MKTSFSQNKPAKENTGHNPHSKSEAKARKNATLPLPERIEHFYHRIGRTGFGSMDAWI